MAELARRHGARFVALAPVLRDPEAFPEAAERIARYRAALAQLARDEGWAWVELPELSESAWPGNAHLFGETIHPNAAGHRRLAAALVPVLRRELRLSAKGTGSAAAATRGDRATAASSATRSARVGRSLATGDGEGMMAERSVVGRCGTLVGAYTHAGADCPTENRSP
jgi:hypothetical protein